MEKISILLSSIDGLTALLIFICYALIDGMYAKYTLEVVALKPLRSATTGSIMHFLLAFGVINYTQNWLYILPLAAGSWVGTYLVVKNENNKACQDK